MVGVATLIGCNSFIAVVDSDGGDQPDDAVMPDFAVVDVNAESPRFQEIVSPRDYLGEISAWYFGAAT